MLPRTPHGLVALVILCAMPPAGSAAQTASGSCALSDAGAAAGWRLEQIAVIPGEHHTAYADFATINASHNDWSHELWDVWTGARLRQLTPPATYETRNSIRVISRDEERVMIDWRMAPASLVDMRTGETLAQIPLFAGEHIECCAYFSDDSRWLVVSVPDGRHEIRNARTGALQGAFQLAPDADDIALSPDGQRLLAADTHALQLVDTTSGALLATLPRRTTDFARLNARFTSDSTRVVIQNGWEWLLLDTQTGAPLAAGGLPGGDGESYLDFPALLDNDAFAQFTDNAGGRAILDVRTGRAHIALGALAGEPTRAVEFGIQLSPDGRRFIARTPEGEATLWDARSGRRLARLGRFRIEGDYEPAPGELEPIVIGGRLGTSNEFVFTPDGERLVSFDAEDRLSLWDAHSGRRIRVLSSDDYLYRYDIHVSADGRWIIVATDPEEFTVWSADTGVRVVRITGLDTSLGAWTLSDDGRYLAIEEDERRELWDLRARRKVADLGAFTRRIYDIAFSRDSAYLLFNRTLDDRTEHMLLWSLAEGRALADLGVFRHANTRTIAGHEIGEGHSASSDDYALWALASAQRLLSCSGAYMTLVQQEGREDVRLLALPRETDELIVWRLTPPG